MTLGEEFQAMIEATKPGLFRRLLRRFGYRIEYVCEWGAWEYRYDRWGGFFNWGHDSYFSRPIHPGMGVAPPWAKLQIKKL
jgi:hypothetical protein